METKVFKTLFWVRGGIGMGSRDSKKGGHWGKGKSCYHSLNSRNRTEGGGIKTGTCTVKNWSCF